MAGSSFGTLFRVMTWGESHGYGLGVVVDGCPAGIVLSEEDIQKYLDRRKPGQSNYSTKRSESDKVRILSGVFDGITTGTPISMMVLNTDQRSRDYNSLKDIYRPGHADIGYDAKYGIRDYRGGGRSSGRETVGRVAAGAVAAKVLGKLGIAVRAYTLSIGPITCNPSSYSEDHLRHSVLCMPDADAENRAVEYLKMCIAEHDSCGGVVECVVNGMPKGIGEPVFDKLDAILGQAIFSIGAVKGVEIGDGFRAAGLRGSINNDQYGGIDLTESVSWEGSKASVRSGGEVPDTSARSGPVKLSNHSGGILGGISDGSDIIIRASFKPTPSIGRAQRALGADGRVHDIAIAGRHDPVIVPRAVVVVESMAAISILDLLMRNMSAKIGNLIELYCGTCKAADEVK